MEHVSRLTMLRLQILLADAQCPLVEWLGFLIPPPLRVEVRQSIQRNRRPGLRLSSLLLPNTQRSLVEPFGVPILPLLVVELRQSIQRNGCLAMRLPHPLLADAQCSQVERLGEAVQRALTEVGASSLKQLCRLGEQKVMLPDQRVARLHLLHIVLTLRP